MKKTLAIFLLLTLVTGTIKSACTIDENGNNTGICDLATEFHDDGSYTMSLVCRKRTEAEKADNVANDCVMPKKKAELGPGF